MLPPHFLKRYFPNTPDWLLGGLFLVFMLWLVVLPMQLISTLIKQEPWTSFLSWLATSFYIWGYVISTFFFSPFSYSAPDQIAILLLSLLFASPIYFAIGALLATKKVVTITLGILLAVINIVAGCLATLLLIRFALSG